MITFRVWGFIPLSIDLVANECLNVCDEICPTVASSFTIRSSIFFNSSDIYIQLYQIAGSWETNKVMKINEQWETLKEESPANIQSEKACCTQLGGTSTNTTVFFMIRSENLKEKHNRRQLRKMCASKCRLVAIKNWGRHSLTTSSFLSKSSTSSHTVSFPLLVLTPATGTPNSMSIRSFSSLYVTLACRAFTVSYVAHLFFPPASAVK